MGQGNEARIVKRQRLMAVKKPRTVTLHRNGYHNRSRNLISRLATEFYYFAVSTTRFSRMTVTFICPGYWVSFSIRLATSRAKFSASKSEMLSG